MNYEQFTDWVENNCPDGVDSEDFIIGLAIGTIKLVEHVASEKNVPIADILATLSVNFEPH